MARFDLVIFDCDGVLIDSESVALPVLGEMLADLGAVLEIEEVHRRFGGLSLGQVIEEVGETLGMQAPGGFAEEFARRSEAVIRRELVPIPGVPELLGSLERPFCTASNAESGEIRVNLGVAGLLDRFEGRIFTASDVERPKPAPDLYLLAARTLGAEPARCAVVEDTPTGVAAGAAAGMQVFGFERRHSSAGLIGAGAARTFTAMEELLGLLQA